MPSIEVNGVLADRLEKLIAGPAGTLWLTLGTFPSLTFSLGYPYSGGLSGRDLVVHSTGTQAVTGRFYFSTLIEFGGADMYPLTLRDFSLDAAALLTLVSRDATKLLVTYHPDAFVAALNAEAWNVTGSNGVDVIAPSAYLALNGSDTIAGLDGNDQLAGGLGRDLIFGGAGEDQIYGSGGTDRLSGGGAADQMFGGAGTDRLDGGAGKDMLSGGDGADVFRFAIGDGADRITDFQDGIDHLSLTSAYTLVEKVGGTLIQYEAGTIFLEGITLAQLGAADFI
jgi:Ca2+-binding RTX toxin-like protein